LTRFSVLSDSPSLFHRAPLPRPSSARRKAQARCKPGRKLRFLRHLRHWQLHLSINGEWRRGTAASQRCGGNRPTHVSASRHTRAGQAFDFVRTLLTPGCSKQSFSFSCLVFFGGSLACNRFLRFVGVLHYSQLQRAVDNLAVFRWWFVRLFMPGLLG
jgi:hypothetical protein